MTLLQLLLPAVLLVLAQSAQPNPAQWKCLYQTAVGFTIKSKYQASTSNKCSLQSCIMTHCDEVKYCAVTFNTESGECIHVSDMAVDQVSKLASSGDLMEERKGWNVIVSQEVKVIVKADRNDWKSVIQRFSPAAFWPLDNENKGRNLGIRGEDLNMNLTGLFWDSKGPKDSCSERRFARFTKLSQANLQLRKNGEFALNLTSFTFGVWIKRAFDESKHATMVFVWSRLLITLDGKFNSDNEVYVSLMSEYQTLITTGKYKFSSNTQLSWHHFAVVSDEEGAPTIYIDGKQVKTDIEIYDYDDSNQVYESDPNYDKYSNLYIGYQTDPKTHYEHLVGGMACLFMSEAVFKPEEIVELKNSCP